MLIVLVTTAPGIEVSLGELPARVWPGLQVGLKASHILLGRPNNILWGGCPAFL